MGQLPHLWKTALRASAQVRGSADRSSLLAMGGAPDRSPVRLAELVAALSLGIDLGFGQPMEHVLRQCLIATRLAERVGLDDQDRAGVYYTALLINVGCHTDAHEQAKWFGDDIDLKATKYDYEHRRASARPWPWSAASARATARCSGCAPASSSRVHGRHDVAGMIAQHAQLAQMLAEELGLADVGVRRARRRLRAVGRQGLARQASRGQEIPIAATDRAAGRVRRGGAPGPRCRRGAGGWPRGAPAAQFDPALVDCLGADADDIFGGLDSVGDLGGGHRRRAGAHGRAVRRAVRRRPAGHRQLRRPQVALHARPLPGRGRAGGRRRPASSGSTSDEVRTLRRAGLVHGFGRLGVSNGIWDKAGPAGRRASGSGCGCSPTSPVGCCSSPRRWRRSGAVAIQHRERLDGSGYPRGLSGCGDLAVRHGSWARSTPTSRCASPARTDRR